MRNNKAKTVAYMGMMLALMLALVFLERLLPPLPLLPPGVNLGLSNIVTMYCIFFLGAKLAFGIAAMKSVFVFIFRGMVAGLLSLCGGLLSVLVIVILLHIFKRKISYVAASICGAVAHNIGQLCAASLILSTGVFYYLPVLIISGAIMGTVTGTMLTVALPVFHKSFGANLMQEPNRKS